MRYVIIGASAAGLAAAETLRRWDPQGQITLVSDEPHLPYSRPLLTYLLAKEISPEQIFLRPANYFAQWGFEARLGEAVSQVDPEARTVRLTGGGALPYDRLLVASGAEPRLLEIPGKDLEGVFTLRHLADVRRLESGLAPDGTVAVVGAGAVGLKAAEALVQRGNRVVLVEAGAHALPRLLDQTAAGFLHRALRDLGIDLYVSVQPTEIIGANGKVRGLALADGRSIRADAVLFAVGVRPRLEFLKGTELDRPEGLRVNEFMQTDYPEIFAAGDCTCPRHLLTGEPAAYQIWPAAVAQGQVAGANMAGAQRRYEGILPQNSISLKGLKIIAGGLLSPTMKGGEVFQELDPRRGEYRRLVFQNGRLVGVILIGPVADAGLYFQVMAQRLPVNQLPVDPRSRDFHAGKLWG